MKLLTTTAAIPFTFRITRTRRRAVINEIAETITLNEVTTTLTLTLPSAWQGVKDKAARIGNRFQRAAASLGNALLDALGGALVPKVCAV